MKFEKITDQLYGARKAGYTFDMTAPRETDDALLDRLSSRMADNLLDEFYDFDGDLYQGDDGEFYAVKFATFDGQEKPVIWQRLTFSRACLIKAHYNKILDEMVAMYEIVLKSHGRCQYQVYIWDDGEIERLQGPQGDHSYLVPRQGEKRDIHYVCTIDAPCFDPWDLADHSAPDDDSEREKEEEEIISYLVNEYRNEGAEAALDAAIEQAEQGDML